MGESRDASDYDSRLLEPEARLGRAVAAAAAGASSAGLRAAGCDSPRWKTRVVDFALLTTLLYRGPTPSASSESLSAPARVAYAYPDISERSRLARPSSSDLASIDDATLVHRIQGGSSEAMDELLRRYWPAMVRYLTRYATCPDAAEDMTQEAFLLLWEGKLTWSGVGTFRSFLFGVARNLARNEGRRWRQFVSAPVEDIDAVNDARYPGPDASLAEKNVAEAFTKAIDSLPPRRREIFTLARVHGMSYPEIAAIMHISTQTVANQMSAALSDLRSALGPVVGR